MKSADFNLLFPFKCAATQQHLKERWLHWQLDVTFLEDVQRTKTENAPENLAITRKLALQMLNKVQDKESIKNRRKMAGWSDQYLINILRNF